MKQKTQTGNGIHRLGPTDRGPSLPPAAGGDGTPFRATAGALCFALALSLVLALPAAAKPRAPGLFHIPTADLLPHSRFLVSSKLNLHQAYTIEGNLTPDTLGLGLADTSTGYVFPYTSELILGIEDRAQFAVQYGGEISVSGKAYIYEETGVIPDIAFGIRGVFGSPEGQLYGITDPDTLRRLRGEAFLAFSKNLGPLTRAHLGTSVIGRIDEGQATFFGGLEQYLGAGFYAGYEIFQRMGGLHQALSFTWKWKEYFAVSLGLTEVQAWVYQNGSAGFYTSPETYQSSGFGSPGISFGAYVSGFTLRDDRESVKARVEELEKRNFKIQTELKEARETLEQVARQVDDLKNKQGGENTVVQNQAEAYLQLIYNRVTSDVPFDPEEIANLRNRILELGMSGVGYLNRLVTNPTSETGLRVQACILMGMSGQAEFIRSLLDATGDPEPQVRRESILALGKIGNKVALEYARNMTQDPDADVVLAAKEALRMLGEDVPEEQQPRERPELP